MNQCRRAELRPRYRSTATFLPPAAVEEAAWDIILALGADEGCELTLEKIARVTSLTDVALTGWLALLEGRQLITGLENEVTNEVRAVLTTAARELLNRYLSATSDLPISTHH